MIYDGQKILRLGAATKFKGCEYELAAERDNRSPKKCWRCHNHNRGDYVYVLESIADEGKESKTAFWCRGCVVDAFGPFDVLLGPLDADEENDL